MLSGQTEGSQAWLSVLADTVCLAAASSRATLKAPQTATFEFASAGYYPMGLNYVTQQAGKPGVSFYPAPAILQCPLSLAADA